ncbi:MAG: hypothetical protein HXX10_20850 [Rhodoplanes sp.]|uniref:hypothetical protein n=1 Tax=Rhodoplanes sp. TaxID=1968906 RepID=UPI0017973C40|nr:hypothetical protein [Rhodoplanes sp.]NVO16484.1 hypothetical protein [Rhodoplanes sp.]
MIRSVLIRAVVVAATLGIVSTSASAACKYVKIDPKCWGDVCPTKKVCNPFDNPVAIKKQQCSFSRRC